MEEKTITISLEEYNYLKKLESQIKKLQPTENDWDNMIAAAYAENDARDNLNALNQKLQIAINTGASEEEILKIQEKIKTATKSANAYKGQVSRYAKKFIDSKYQEDYIDKTKENIEEKQTTLKTTTEEEIQELKKEIAELKRRLKKAENNIEQYSLNQTTSIKPTFNKENFTEKQLQKIKEVSSHLHQARDNFKQAINESGTLEQLEKLNADLKNARITFNSAIKKMQNQQENNTKTSKVLESQTPEHIGNMTEIIKDLPIDPKVSEADANNVRENLNKDTKEENGSIKESPTKAAAELQKNLDDDKLPGGIPVNFKEAIRKANKDDSKKYIGTLDLTKDTESDKKRKRHGIKRIRKAIGNIGNKVKKIVHNKVAILVGGLTIAAMFGTFVAPASKEKNKKLIETTKVETIQETADEYLSFPEYPQGNTPKIRQFTK